MRRILRPLAGLAFFLCCIAASCDAADLDPAYLTTFGQGVILVSGQGFLKKTACDPAQVDRKDGACLIPAGPTGRMDLRVILPAGETLATLASKARALFAAEALPTDPDIGVFRLWCSHDADGKEYPGASWPSSLAEEPKWEGPYLQLALELDETNRTWNTQALSWEDHLQSKLGTRLAAAQPGWRYYLTYCVGFMAHSDGPALATDSHGHRALDPNLFRLGPPAAAVTILLE